MGKFKSYSKRKKFTIVICTILAIVAAAYFGGVYYYSTHFLKGTKVNGVDYSNKAAADVEASIKKNIGKYKLEISERKKLKDGFKGSDIKLTYLNDGAISSYQKSQNAFLWPAGYFGETYSKDIKTISYDAKTFDKIFNSFVCFDKKNITKPVNAYPKYAGKNKYKIVKEIDGNLMNKSKLKEQVLNCVENGISKLNASKAGCYVEPKYRSNNKQIVALKKKMDHMVSGSITWDYSKRYINLTKYKKLLKNNRVAINGNVTHQFIEIKDDTKAVINKKKLEDWIISYANDSNTIYKSRKFISHSGNQIVVPAGGPYGWRMNCDKEMNAILKMMKDGKKEKVRQPYYRQTACTGTNGKLNDIGKTYVEVDISAQSVYVYKDGKRVFTTSCVTGNTSLGRGTHTGACVVQYKQRNKILGGPGYSYASFVRYWMPFNGGEGLHDADWRNSFGGSIYRTGGSHGCVNLPISSAATIYNIIDAGWPVIVHY